ncbi:hypothetical protein F8388_001118 [Cannabis sativa]|uniref:RNase H type-1 domain-containing protein n=1 Tax=Cannabis sativa TaxID=3483 RepID=A0A7J6EFG4_CANSA|nr:hypothetical protein F8388_001118 [Cannabis sativa]
MLLGEHKLNVDVALDVRKRCSGLGAVVRDREGHIVASFSAPKVGASSPLFAGAHALFYALLWCSAIICLSLTLKQIVFN